MKPLVLCSHLLVARDNCTHLEQLLHNSRGSPYLLSSEEEQDVALALLAHVDLDHGADGCLQVVPLGLGRVEDLHGVRAPGDGQQRAAVKVHLELSGIQCGAHDDDLVQESRKLLEVCGF